jgi:hypothetical protein
MLVAMTDPTTPASPVPPPAPEASGAATAPPPAPLAPAPAPAAKTSNGLRIASLVLGILGFIFAWTPAAGLGIVLGVLGLIFGIISLVRPGTKGLPLISTILSGVAIILGIIMAIVYTVIGVASVTSTGDLGGTTSGSQAASPSEAPASSTSWYDDTFGTFAPINKTGTGDSVIALPAGAKAGIVTATHAGSANFVIQGLDSSNQPTLDLLVNTIGNYSGTTAFGLISLGAGPTSLQITADGAWTISITQISSAKSSAVPIAGTGDQVFLYDGKAAAWAITNAGQSNFVVEQYSKGSLIANLAVNEIGAYTGTDPMQAGPSVVVVQSDGNWTIN